MYECTLVLKFEFRAYRDAVLRRADSSIIGSSDRDLVPHPKVRSIYLTPLKEESSAAMRKTYAQSAKPGQGRLRQTVLKVSGLSQPVDDEACRETSCYGPDRRARNRGMIFTSIAIRTRNKIITRNSRRIITVAPAIYAWTFPTTSPASATSRTAVPSASVARP